MSYKAEVIAEGGDKWSTNGVAFATKDEAEAYAKDLEGRWMMVREWRVVESDQPVNYAWKDGQAERVETAS